MYRLLDLLNSPLATTLLATHSLTVRGTRPDRRVRTDGPAPTSRPQGTGRAARPLAALPRLSMAPPGTTGPKPG
ncbi:hypothetical protein ACRJ4W_00535 [Streptomyces sp. GLT-R25]